MTAPTTSSFDTLRVYDNILQAIGRTPLIRLNRVVRGLAPTFYAKLESLNPGGSVKDRIGLNIIEEAERASRLKPGGTVVEATSGNTGVGLALACAIKGYKAVFVMPDKMSEEKVRLLRAFGARVVITPTAVAPDDPRSYTSVAQRIVAETPNSILANQYHNPRNPESHYLTTGPEIWEQSEGRVTDVVIGMGTGGTITGVGRFLKEKNPDVRVVGVDPQGSLLYETWKRGRLPQEIQPRTYKVEGIGEDFLPSILDLSIVDEVIQVDDRESFLVARRLVREEGLFVGGSSGSALAGAMRYARDLGPERWIVVILPDSGSRYLSKFLDDAWMRENGFLESDMPRKSVAELLSAKPPSRLICVSLEDHQGEVVRLFREHDISQVPVLNSDGSLAGVVSEVDLLNHLLSAEHSHSPQEDLRPVTSPQVATVRPEDSLDKVMSALLRGPAVVVVEEDRPVGVLTKIDLLEYLAGQHME